MALKWILWNMGSDWLSGYHRKHYLAFLSKIFIGQTCISMYVGQWDVPLDPIYQTV